MWAESVPDCGFRSVSVSTQPVTCEEIVVKQIADQDISFDEFDEINYPRPDVTDFAVVAEKFISRRSFLRGTAAIGASAFVLGAASLPGRQAQAAAGWLAFEPVAANGDDAITVPKGFSHQVVARWGDPLWTHGVEFDHSTRGTGATPGPGLRGQQ